MTRWQSIRAIYDKCASLSELAKQTGYSPSRLWAKLREFGPLRPQGGSKGTPQRKTVSRAAAIRDLRAAGWPDRAIAAELGVNRDALGYLTRRYLPTR